MSRYTPRGDSLARKVIDFLMANPDDELTPKDVGVKFDTDAKSVHASLKAPVENGWLVKVHNDDLELVFRLGPQALNAGGPFAQLTGSAPPQATIDVTADRLRMLCVDDDVPINPPKPEPGEKWQPLFAKLTRPGQSIAIPMDWRTSLSREATRRNNLQTGSGPTYKVGKCHKTAHARIWRVT